MTTSDLHRHLHMLSAERAAAALEGLDLHARYADDLREELEATRHAYIGAAVTEIASLRAALGAPLVG